MAWFPSGGCDARLFCARLPQTDAVIEILQHLAAGFVQVFALKTFSAMVLGMLIGFAVGILPGLGGPATLALLIPFTFGMDPFQAMALLLGMITVTGTAGDITAVLFGIPGETASAATVVVRR